MSTALTTVRRYSGGGAGIQNISKTIILNGVFAMGEWKAPPLENTTGVSRTFGSAVFLTEFFDSVRELCKDLPGRIFLLSVTKAGEEGHHG